MNSNWIRGIAVMYGLLFVCMLFPKIVLWLPRLMGY